MRTPKAFLGFASFIYLTAVNEMPHGIMRMHRVYNGKLGMDELKVRRFFTQYLKKLKVTESLLLKQANIIKSKRKDDTLLSADQAVELFESDVNIDVKVRSSSKRMDFMANTNIGLARDCPVEEYDRWYDFVKETTRKFIRYIREPRRAVKHSVNGDFKLKSAIKDEKIFLLDEDRLEDIEYRLQEEELRMVETTTSRLFNTKEYTDQMEKADKVVRNGIAKRLTKLKIILSSAIALLAFMIGFVPLLIKNNDSSSAFSATLKIVGGAAGVMLLVSVIFMLVVRYLQVRRIKFFNATMNNIFDDIENGLAAFSRYLSHACNVMREFSVFKYLKSEGDPAYNILRKHIFDIRTKIDGVNGLFASMLEVDGLDDTMPYNYDFTKLQDYVYDIPYEELDNTIEFLAKDNFVSIPIDYVRDITLEREELYD